jgi:HlyD family secretion protein
MSAHPGDMESGTPPLEAKAERLRSLQFRRDRETVVAVERTQRPTWLIAAAAALGGAVIAGAALFLLQDAGPAGTAPAAPSGAQSDRASAPPGALVASGYVVARRRATIASEVTGRLMRLAVEEGQPVTRGQVIAHLDNVAARAELAGSLARAQSSQAALSSRSSQLAEAERELERTETLAARGFATGAQLTARQSAVEVARSNVQASRAEVAAAAASVASARSLMAKFVIVAPFSGIVVSTNAEVGEIISPISAGGGFTRTGICTIVDMNSLEVEVEVNEALIGQVRVGQPVQAVLDAFPDLALAGQVLAIIPTANREKSTIRVRVGFLETDPRILPDMAIKVTFDNKRGKENV